MDLIIFSIGLVIGVTSTRYYYEKTKKFAIGKSIQAAMISDSVNILLEYNKELSSLLLKFQTESSILNQQIMKSRDIESFSNDSIQEDKSDDSFSINSNSNEDDEKSHN